MHPDRLGPFKLGSIIGSGGFGTVYRAEDAEGRAVAIKVLAPHVDSKETLQRFQLEGTIRIEHPHVVKVIDAGEDGGVSYIAFELLIGVPLQTRLEDAPLPPADVISMGRQICLGLAAAHERDIVHRDLKPGNVFQCEDGVIKILDFGIARPMSQAGPQLTMAGSVIGTPGYLSPEQAKGESDIQPAADLWALGVILYQALSGKNPFIRSTAVATILAVVLEEAPPLDESLVPRPLANAVMRCLEKDPKWRWGSAADFAEALAEIDLSDSVAPTLDSIPPSMADDEQRVVAVLLASEVHDLPMLSAAVDEWGGQLIPIVGGAIGVFGGQTYEGDEGTRATRAALQARPATRWVAVSTGRATGTGGTIGGAAVRAVERAVEAKLSGVAIDASTARALEGDLEVQPTSEEGVFEVPPNALLHRDTGTFPTVRAGLPLLGRRAELAQLDAALANAFDDGRATALTVVGPPGIGKSRLRAELEQRLAERGIETLTGRGESHRRDNAFQLMSTVLRSEPTLEPFFLNPGIRTEHRRRALVQFLGAALDDDAWAQQTAEPISLLLGLPDDALAETRSLRAADPQRLTDRVRVALSDVLGALIEKRPLALVIDDAQWADEPSLRFLDELLGRESDRPLLLFLATRPEMEERHPWLFAERDVLRVRPRGLGSTDVGTLCDSIAGREVPRTIAKEVAQRTEGNPFFVEQIVRELVENDLLDGELSELPIPVDVQGAVQSRLDHLPTDEKQLCKRAAVFAGAFTESALAAVSVEAPTTHLGSLSRRGLISTQRRRASAPDVAYWFRNELVAEVAYGMNGDDARRELHRMAALFLAELPYTDPEELGTHYERAEMSLEAAAAFAEAAIKAARRGDSRSVLRCADRALSLGLTGPRAFDLTLARADALSFLGERDAQREVLEEALQRAQSDTEQARALSEKVGYLAQVQSHDEGLPLADRAVEAARTTDAPDVLATALVRRGWLLLYAGRIAEASESIQEAAAIPALSKETLALVAAWRAQLFSAMGDLGKRKAAYEQAVARYRDLGDLRRAATAECNLADTLNRVGAYADAERALTDAVSACRRVGNRVVEGYALVNLGYAQAGSGQLAEARSSFDEAEALAGSLGRPRLAVAVRLYRARTMFEDAPAEGRTVALSVAEEASTLGLRALAASAHAIASRHALRAEDASGALEAAEAAMRLRDEIGTLEEDEAEIFLALSEALAANGRDADAREIAARGASRLEFLAGRIEDPSWRARFLVEVPVNRRLIELDGD
ncbi:MAG: protein kinase [Sandaracinaceae bacterium]